MGFPWRDTRWRILPYVVYICRNGNIVLGNRRYVPLWVWEREPSGKSNPEWTPVNKRAFVKGIVWLLYAYNDSNCNLPQKKMIDHVNTMLHSFHVGGLPRGWNQHRQATDQEAWRACYSPEDGDMVLDYRWTISAASGAVSDDFTQIVPTF